jgi:hypothetical protein
MPRPLTPEEECTQNTLPRTYEYYQCLISKGINPYTFSIAPPSSIKDILKYMAIGVGVAIILLIIYFSIKLKMSPIDLVKYFILG